MVNEYKGDSHFDPSGGIGLSTAIVEDGELEYKGYVFSKDSEENKKLRREKRIREIRTDEDDHVWDRISRESLNRAAVPLVESHEKNRLDRLMADLEKAEKGLDKAGIPPQGDMMSDPSQMTQGLPMMADGGTIPKVTTNQQYDQSFIDPSNMNDASTAFFSPVGTKKDSSQQTMNQITGLGAAAGNAAGSLTSQYLDTTLQNKEHEGFGIADTVMTNIPVVGQFYGMGNAINEPIKDWQADATKRDGATSAEATTATALSGAINPMDGWSQNAAAYESGALSESEAIGNIFAQAFLPGFANQSVNQANEDMRRNNEILAKLKNRDNGGTDMDPRQERNRQIMADGGMKKSYADGGPFPKKAWEYVTGKPQEAVNPPYIFGSYSSGEQVFDINQNLPVMMQPVTATKIESPVAEYFSINTDPINYSVSGNATGPDTPMSPVGSQNINKKKIDWANIGESVGMGLLSNVGNLAYLADQGKDYDKVDYGSFNPEMVNTSSSRRAIRDAMATSKEALKESGRLDRASMAQLGTQGAKQLADAEERIRLANTGMFNDAQLKNIDINMREQTDEAQNKGQALTNYYNALNALGQNTQAAYRGYNLRMSDAEKQRLVAENNKRLQDLVESIRTQ